MAADLPKRFAEEMGRLLGPEFPKHLALAVSGGGDSMAMLYLAAPWARVMGIDLYVCTVNHGLRPEAGDEAALVRRACAELGLYHEELHWAWDGHGNLQEAAREGRLAAISNWRGGITHVLMAHTQDDQAETVLMRLARGSGVDGLSGIPERRRLFAPPEGRGDRRPDGPPWPPRLTGNLEVLRPLLGTSRAELRHFCDVLRIDYADDPSNEDTRFERVKWRKALPALAELGLSVGRLAETARTMARARAALETRAWAAFCADPADDPAPNLFDMVFDRDTFAQTERETQLRLLSAALRYVGLEDHPPRLAPLEDALDRALGGGATTLHGGYVYPHQTKLYICAEYERVKATALVHQTWRGLYETRGLDVRVLGPTGAAQLRDQTDLPARVLWPCPAVWSGDRVLASPRLGPNDHWNPDPDLARLERLFTSR